MLNCATNYHDDLFSRLIGGGVPLPVAVERVAGAYLDGKPLQVGKRKLTKKERDSLFWSSNVVKECLPDSWNAEAMVLALARYLGQESVAAEGLVTRVAREAPDALTRAVRYSALVLKSHSPRRAELDRAASESEAVAKLCRVLDLFVLAHRERIAAVEVQKARLAGLSVFDLLIYASLYAFEVLVPRDFEAKAPIPPAGADLQLAWDALNDLLAWKLAGASISSLKLADDSIGKSVARHLRPILFESGTTNAREAVRSLRALHALMDAQIELNEFISRSAEAFCYDEGIRFERRGDRLEIVETDPAARAAWQDDGRKLERLHSYWFHRAIEAFVEYVASDPARWEIGRPENADANRLAWLRALQAQLRLREAYGVADEVTSESGDTVDLFHATRRPGNTRIVNKGIKTAEFVCYDVENAVHVGVARDIGNHCLDIGKFALNPGHSVLGNIADGDTRALGPQCLRDGIADAGTASSDQYPLAFEPFQQVARCDCLSTHRN